MRAMRAEGFSGYKDLKLADIPKPQMSEGRVLVKIAAAGVTLLEHTILSGGYLRTKLGEAFHQFRIGDTNPRSFGQRSPNCATLAHRQPGCDQPDFAVQKFVS
jgi:hypothetical protein